MQYNSLSPSRASGERRPRLGTYGKSGSAQEPPGFDEAKMLRERHDLQDEAARLLPYEAVTKCGRLVAPMASGVSVLYDSNHQSAHYGGLERCHSVWMCPICAAKITERRRIEMMQGLQAARLRGYRVVMCTYTFRHHRGQHLADLLRMLMSDGKDEELGAWKRYKSGRKVNKLYRDFAVFGSIRALEVNFSYEHSWHVHIHELVLLPVTADSSEFGHRARALWKAAAARSGLDMDEHGFKLDDCDEKIVEYVTKFNRLPSEKTLNAYKDGWNEANELTKWHSKRGKVVRLGQDEHVTPMQLLRYSMLGDEQAGSLFVEYAMAFKGHRQLVWSRGLKEALGLQEKTDEEVNDEEEESAEELVFIRSDEWRVVVGNAARAEVLIVARSGNRDVVADLLYALGLERFAPGGVGREKRLHVA